MSNLSLDLRKSISTTVANRFKTLAESNLITFTSKAPINNSVSNNIVNGKLVSIVANHFKTFLAKRLNEFQLIEIERNHFTLNIDNENIGLTIYATDFSRCSPRRTTIACRCNPNC